MKNECCQEYWNEIPFRSEHFFDTDGFPYFNPTKCISCGKSAQQYKKEMLGRFKNSKIGEEFVIKSGIQLRKLNE